MVGRTTNRHQANPHVRTVRLKEAWKRKVRCLGHSGSNERCDQEKVTAQLGSGIAAWRNPVAELAGNCAWLEIARLAWNLGKWVAQLALAAEVVRWEWKRFRHAFVVVPAQVLRKAAQIWLRVSGSHRFVEEFLAAHVRLQR